MSARRLIVDSDIIRDHVYGRGRPSTLRMALNGWFCYTTVFNVIELFARAASRREERAIEDALSGMKLLGLNARNAKQYAMLRRTSPRAGSWALLVAGLCRETGLPLLTGRPRRYSRVRGLKMIPPAELRSLRRRGGEK